MKTVLKYISSTDVLFIDACTYANRYRKYDDDYHINPRLEKHINVRYMRRPHSLIIGSSKHKISSEWFAEHAVDNIHLVVKWRRLWE